MTSRPPWALPGLLLACGAAMALLGRVAVTIGSADDSFYLLGELGGLTLAVGLVASAVVRPARRPIGSAVLVVDVVLAVVSVAGEGHLIWADDVAEAYEAVVALTLTGLALLVTGDPVPPRSSPSTVTVTETGGLLARPSVRAVGYLVVSIIVVVIAFGLGTAHVDATRCTDGAECDVGALEGIFWVLVTLPFLLVAVVVAEWAVAHRRRAARPAAR